MPVWCRPVFPALQFALHLRCMQRTCNVSCVSALQLQVSYTCNVQRNARLSRRLSFPFRRGFLVGSERWKVV
jgi:hypothetical protein